MSAMLTPNIQHPLLSLLRFVNPFSGSRQGKKIFSQTVEPMLIEASISYTLITTTHAGHASEYMSSLTSVDFNGVIVIGGDGLLFEILNGLSSNETCGKEIISSVGFGIVSAGSGNGLAKSVTYHRGEELNAMQCVFAILCGLGDLAPRRADLCTYNTQDGKEYKSFLSLSWGIIADVDLESEVLRCCGPFRLDVYAVWRMLALRRYRGRLSYYNGAISAETMPSLTSPAPSTWTTIEDDFICLWACNTTHASYDIMSSPESTWGDGVFKIVVIRKGGRGDLLNMVSLSLEP